MNKRIYITHCSAKKDDSLRGTKKKVTPDKLYTANLLQRFVKNVTKKALIGQYSRINIVLFFHTIKLSGTISIRVK